MVKEAVWLLLHLEPTLKKHRIRANLIKREFYSCIFRKKLKRGPNESLN